MEYIEFTLPKKPNNRETIEISTKFSLQPFLFKIKQNPRQYIEFGNVKTTIGKNGSIESTLITDEITLVYLGKNHFKVLCATGHFLIT